MQIKVSKAHPDDQARYVRVMRHCVLDGNLLRGFPYDDPLAGRGGIELVLLVPEGTDKAACEAAIREGRRQRDVVSHRTVICPREWFIEAGIELTAPVVTLLANSEERAKLHRLFFYAVALEENWERAGTIDWSEAETLVSLCRGIPSELHELVPQLLAIISHADENADWDSNEVGNWPIQLSDELDSLLCSPTPNPTPGEGPTP